MKRTLAAVLLLLCSPLASAQFSVDVQDYRVLYSATNASALGAKVARQYGVSRGRNIAIVSFNVQRRDAQGVYSSVAASGTASAATLIGQKKDVPLRSVRDGEIDTLIGEVRFDNGEFLAFEATITPNGSKLRIPVKFRQQFYRD